MIKLAPSILSADFAKLGQQIKQVEEAGASILHVDVMDGHFVPNISFGHPVIQSIRGLTSLFFDVHLMVQAPERQIESFAAVGADGITIHIEATNDPMACIKQIKALGLSAAVSIKPQTAAQVLVPYLGEVDMVLIMSVEPGQGGQKIMTDTIEKARAIANMKREGHYDFAIEMDGGVTLANVRQMLDAGVNVIVAGSSVFGAADIGKAVRDFHRIFDDYAARG